MRDIVITYPNNDEDEWNLDIDIIDGEPRYVETVNQTQDQRAAVAALISKGTIPGELSLGIDWGSYLSGDVSLLMVNNQVRQQITRMAAIGDNTQLTSYMPIFQPNKNGGVDIHVYRAQ